MHIETNNNAERLIQGITAQDRLVAEAAIDGVDDQSDQTLTIEESF